MWLRPDPNADENWGEGIYVQPPAERLAEAQAEADNKIVNLTPHEVRLVTRDGDVIIPASGQVARVTMYPEPVGQLAGVMLAIEPPGFVEGLPAPEDGRYYLVSALVRLACPERADLISPGALVRDEQGRVVGCQSLIRNDWTEAEREYIE